LRYPTSCHDVISAPNAENDTEAEVDEQRRYRTVVSSVTPITNGIESLAGTLTPNAINSFAVGLVEAEQARRIVCADAVLLQATIFDTIDDADAETVYSVSYVPIAPVLDTCPSVLYVVGIFSPD